MKDANNSFGFNLKRYRIAKNLSQGELSARINRMKEGNLSRNQLSNYENGVSFPSIPILVILSDILDVSCDVLLGKTPEHNLYPASSDLPDNYQQLDAMDKIKILESLTNNLLHEKKELKLELANQKANVITIIDQLKKDLK